MVDPLSVIAGAITSLILPKAVEKVGEKLGEAALEKSGAAIQAARKAVQDKLQEVGTAGLLKRVEEKPTEHNVQVLEAELVSQMEEDQAFANQMQELVNQIQAQSASFQDILSRLRAENAEIGGKITQEIEGQGRSTQRIVNESAIKNLWITGEVHQKKSERNS